MSLLIPAGLVDAPRAKVALTSMATFGSTSIAAFGTNLVAVPFYAHLNASAAGLAFSVYNGTAGSLLIRGTSVQGSQDIHFWLSPGSMAANKPLVLETAATIGTHEFHVYAVVTRGGAPSDPLAQ